MDMLQMQLATEAIARMAAIGRARNRDVDTEPRTLTLTDDEAVAVLDFIDLIAPGGLYHLR